MIYNLYINIAGWSKLDVDSDKKNIIDTIVFDNKKNGHTWYKIVAEDDQKPPKIPTESITLRSQEEIDNYVNAFNERQRLDNMPIVELKKYILKNQK